MTLPFTPQQFFEVMQRYNEAVWPMQVVLTLVALASVVIVWTPVQRRSVLISGALALLWTWCGLVYHLGFFYAVNPAALLFGGLFLAAAAAFAWQGVVKQRLHFVMVPGPRTVAGLALIAYALVVYPELAAALGHAYPRTPTFGLPCPLTIFTIGLAAFLAPPFPRTILVAPLLWSVIALQAVFLFGMYEDLGLVAAALVAAWILLQPRNSARPA